MQWDRELPPGTLLKARLTCMFAVVLRVSTSTYVNSWHELHLTVLLSNGTLHTFDMDEDFFRRTWQWNL